MTFVIHGRVLAPEYLEARGEAFEDANTLDPLVELLKQQDEATRTALWLAFMAGSEWERGHRGRRYADEMTSA